jgi:hypothetical protein
LTQQYLKSVLHILTHIKPLQLIEHTALRVILGVPRTSNTWAMYTEAELQPLEQRIKTLSALTYLRLAACKETTTNEPRLSLGVEIVGGNLRATTRGTQIHRVIKFLEPILATSGGIVQQEELVEHIDPRIRMITNLETETSHNLQSAWDALKQQYSIWQQYHVTTYVEKIQSERSGFAINYKDTIVGASEERVNGRCPSFTNQRFTNLSAVSAAISMAANKGNQNIVIFMDARELILELTGQKRNFVRFCVTWAMTETMVNLHIVYVPKTVNSEYRYGIEVEEVAVDEQNLVEVIIPSSYEYLKSRVKAWSRKLDIGAKGSFLAENIDYEHLAYKWNVNQARHRATETTITRIRLNRPRLREDLFRWKLSLSQNCLYCQGIPETTFHFLFCCPARQMFREELEEFFCNKDIVNPYKCVLSLGQELKSSERRLLLILLEQYLIDCQLARCFELS